MSSVPGHYPHPRVTLSPSFAVLAPEGSAGLWCPQQLQNEGQTSRGQGLMTSEAQVAGSCFP